MDYRLTDPRCFQPIFTRFRTGQAYSLLHVPAQFIGLMHFPHYCHRVLTTIGSKPSYVERRRITDTGMATIRNFNFDNTKKQSLISRNLNLLSLTTFILSSNGANVGIMAMPVSVTQRRRSYTRRIALSLFLNVIMMAILPHSMVGRSILPFQRKSRDFPPCSAYLYYIVP